MGIIYFLVAIIATTLGALAGLGGGVIIKPSLDMLGHYDISTISLLSTFTVFSMAAVSTYKQVRKGFIIRRELIYIASGSILGGIIGSTLFRWMLTLIDEGLASGLQALILAFLLILVLMRKILPDFEVKNPVIVFIVGMLLGTTASFLGIGGGPINVLVILMILNMRIKEAAVGSVFIILLSQLSKIITFAVTTGFGQYDLTMLYFMIPGAISGGLIGSQMNQKLNPDHINIIFNSMVAVLVLLNLFNAYNFLMV